MAIQIADFRFIYHKVGGQEVYFEASNQDTSGATYQYFGYISSSGSWIIQRFHIIGSAIIYRYSAGQDVSDYITRWDTNGLYLAGTPALTFGRFDEISTL